MYLRDNMCIFIKLQESEPVKYGLTKLNRVNWEIEVKGRPTGAGARACQACAMCTIIGGVLLSQ